MDFLPCFRYTVSERKVKRMTYSEKLTALRKEKGFTQEQLADRLGVTRQAVSRWEAGETAPDMASIVKLCEVFGVSADYLIREDCGARKETPSPAAGFDKNNLHLISAVCFAIAAFCSVIGIVTHTTDTQLALSCLTTALFSVNMVLQFVLYLKGKRR